MNSVLPEPASRPPEGSIDPIDHYHRQGFAVVKGVFDQDEVGELAAAFDRIYAEGLTHRRSYRDGNVLFRLAEDSNLGRIVRYVQWPSYFDAVMQRFRVDPRMLAIVRPLIGDNLKQIINQLHWKPPGAASAEFGFHQDIRFRRPRSAYRRPGETYIQTGIAVDAHRCANGAMVFIPGSHRRGELSVSQARVMDTPLDEQELVRLGLDPASAVHLELDPGDVAFWHLYAVHGSGPNQSPSDRRLYINGYVDADSCDRGEWAFRAGRPVAPGAPVLVHYDDLYTRPGPYYLD